MQNTDAVLPNLICKVQKVTLIESTKEITSMYLPKQQIPDVILKSLMAVAISKIC